MELFDCNRYLGSQSSSIEATNLDDYINKIQSRKKKRASLRDIDVSDKFEHLVDVSGVSDEPVASISKSKSDVKIKKRDLKVEDCEESQPSSKKKKRGTSEELISNEIIDSVAEQGPSGNLLPSVESPSKVKKKPSKKKKKKKLKVTSNDDIVKHDENLKEEIIQDKEILPEITYEVLGNHSFENKSKVKRVLPRWLAAPTIIANDLEDPNFQCMNADQLNNLNHRLKINLIENEITSFFPVQSAVIPYQLANCRKANYVWPRDLCVSAPTGSGKTLAYVLPILQVKSGLIGSVLHALVIVPVQELALQVASVFKKYAKGTGIKIGCATGGTPFISETKYLVRKKSDGSYASQVDVLVATPGRLVEHIQNTPGFTLENLRFIVIDEADRVMEQKSLNWLHLVEKQFDPEGCGAVPSATIHNLSRLPRRPQKLLFSATLSQDPEKLLQLNLFQPKLITSVANTKINKDPGDPLRGHFCGKFTTPTNLTEFFTICEESKKPLVIHKLLYLGWRKVLCFTKSCEEARRLSKLLQNLNTRLNIRELSTLLVLSQREHILSDFGQGKIDLLVCSDRLARGMDIKEVNYVILYDSPKYVKGYIHRIGRTGRAGLDGTALTILTTGQANQFHEMLKEAGKTNILEYEIDSNEFNEMELSYSSALSSLRNQLEKEVKTAIVRTKLEKRKKFHFKGVSKKKFKLA